MVRLKHPITSPQACFHLLQEEKVRSIEKKSVLLLWGWGKFSESKFIGVCVVCTERTSLTSVCLDTVLMCWVKGADAWTYIHSSSWTASPQSIFVCCRSVSHTWSVCIPLSKLRNIRLTSSLRLQQLLSVVLKTNTTQFSALLHCCFLHSHTSTGCQPVFSSNAFCWWSNLPTLPLNRRCMSSCEPPPVRTDGWSRIQHESGVRNMRGTCTHTHLTDRNYIRQDFKEQQRSGCAWYSMQILILYVK